MGHSVNFLQRFSDTNKIDAPPVQGLEQSNSLKSSVNFLDCNTSSMETVSCENAWWAAYREVKTKLRHSTSMRPKIEVMLANIDVVLEQDSFQPCL